MKLLPILFCLLFVAPATAQYYADVEINVMDTGQVTITGETNHPKLQVETSPQFTSKMGAYWLLNISLEQNFTDYIYRVRLPKGAEVNYMKLPRMSRIEDENGRLSVVGTGQNKPFIVTLQYSFRSGPAQLRYYWILIPIGILFIGFLVRRRKTKMPQIELTDRQKEIYGIIRKHRSITQAQIEKTTRLPKSSLSRNIESLEKKGLIDKKRKGMSNILVPK